MSGKLTSYGLKAAQIGGKKILLFRRRKWFCGAGAQERPLLAEQVSGTACWYRRLSWLRMEISRTGRQSHKHV